MLYLTLAKKAALSENGRDIPENTQQPFLCAVPRGGSLSLFQVLLTLSWRPCLPYEGIW